MTRLQRTVIPALVIVVSAGFLLARWGGSDTGHTGLSYYVGSTLPAEPSGRAVALMLKQCAVGSRTEIDFGAQIAAGRSIQRLINAASVTENGKGARTAKATLRAQLPALDRCAPDLAKYVRSVFPMLP